MLNTQKMSAVRTLLLIGVLVWTTGCQPKGPAYPLLNRTLIQSDTDHLLSDSIMFHPVRVDQNGHILPWYSANLGVSYDHVLHLVWDFWKNMRVDSNGIRYYMNHQVWKKKHNDKRGIGGDQIAMALSSWNLWYGYTGDTSVIANMEYMADYYLDHSLSSPDSQWPDLPYPYNTVVLSGEYDGDMILGKGYLQPDKAGSLGQELIRLYKITGKEKYLDAAIKIANTLADKIRPGDADHSPWPFKVNAETGKTGILVFEKVWHEGMAEDSATWSHSKNQESAYTTNWTGTLMLFKELTSLDKGDTAAYQRGFQMALSWMKAFPVKNNKWGPFFEDVPGWSDTQVNAITYAMFLTYHPQYDSSWKRTVANIFSWVHQHLDNQEYRAYGVMPINEQTAYRVPGNSHSSREASVELMYWEKTGDTTYTTNDVRMLSWATYMVSADGMNQYPRNGVWMTDGYGDYVRHYLRAMAAAPQLAPYDQNHLLRTSSTIRQITYDANKIDYHLFDDHSEDVLRLTRKPTRIQVDSHSLKEIKSGASGGWSWQPLDHGGILRINQTTGHHIEIVL